MAQPRDPARDQAQIQLMVGGTVTLIAGGMLVFGHPSQPGDGGSAFFRVLEDMLGYYPLCGLLLLIGLGWSAFGAVLLVKANNRRV